MMTTRYEANKEFKNWSQSIEMHPARTYRPSGIDELIPMVKEGQRLGRRVRAVGAGWSFSDVMATPDFLIDTTAMSGVVAFSQGRQSWGPTAAPERSRILVNALRDEVLDSDRRLVDVKAGTSIKTLIQALDQPAPGDAPRSRWALPTMGGASGQTLAGAINTGTHGGHFDLAPIPDMVQAMYLVGPDGRRHWIERGGAGAICDPEKLKRLLRLDDGSLHQDDEWFRAALVSMGNLGIVVNYILEVREQYGISEQITETTWRDLAPSLTSGEVFSTTRYSQRDSDRKWLDAHPAGEGREPLGLGVFINPYRLSDNYSSDPAPDRRVMLASHAGSSDFDGGHVGPAGASIFEQMHLIGDFESAENAAQCRTVVDRVIDMLRSSEGTGGQYRVAHSVLDTTSGDDRPPILSMEIVVTTEGGQHVRFVDRLLEIFDNLLSGYRERGVDAKFAGGLNLRFTRASEAFLGMQSATSRAPTERFCHIEVIAMREQWVTGRPIGADYTENDMENYTEVFTDAFERATDAFGARLHWGQMSRTRRHDPDKYAGFNRWLAVKRQITNGGAYRTFENDFSIRHLSPQRRIALRTSNGQYLVAEDGGGRELLANRTVRRAWETFKMIRLGGNRVALRADNGDYVCAEGGGGGPLVANRPHIRAWETFELVSLDGGHVALRASNGQYVVAEEGGGAAVRANRDHRRSWETFSLENVD